MTQDIKDVLKLALEALEVVKPHYTQNRHVTEAITAIKEALREHAMREVQRLGQEIEQEPVAWINVEKRRLEFAEPMVWHTPTVVKLERIPLYTHQRTWVGLTNEQIEDAWRKVETGDFYDCVQPFARAIEAKLRQKNSQHKEKNT